MARVTIEDCLEKEESRFALVHLAVRRVLQLRAGAVPLVEAPKNKEIVLSLREIAAGKVSLDNIREIEEAKALPVVPSQEKEDSTHLEVKEILEAATQYDASLEYDDKEQFLEQGQEED